ncbi:hypothetical protein BDP55DRAFT_687460 [Colletotrichum godetiae]|uniref:Uncharacterized protein n=1 Tax=Colletotrichum godetiae TaxID=1209918 RepID=A0AAJ0A8C9_9PEZI|nr:uncharacterized protein BDP55DRAFT_687460 [Colletotrichum godetiae]KAK1656936.1 hypothetical protein BDP55DRAFT_687460 [Colletotrichum godetiae]
MSDTGTVPELPSIKKYTVPRTIFMYRKTIESQGKSIQQLEAVVFAQQDHAYRQYQTILKLQEKILYLRELRVLQQNHIEKQANSLVRRRFCLSQHLTKIVSIKSDLQDIADNLMETQNFAQQTSSELPDSTPSERLEKCVAKLERFGWDMRDAIEQRVEFCSLRQEGFGETDARSWFFYS